MEYLMRMGAGMVCLGQVHQVSSVVDDTTIGEKGFDKVLKAVSTERLCKSHAQLKCRDDSPPRAVA